VPEEWLFKKLEERTGARGYAIPDSRKGRSDLARQLLGDDDSNPCYLKGGKTPVLVTGGPVDSPQRIQASYYKPLFPEKDRRAREETKLLMAAVIAEDGVVRDVMLLDVQGHQGEFYASAMSAVSLWRYKPAVVDGCPIDVYFTIRVEVASAGVGAYVSGMAGFLGGSAYAMSRDVAEGYYAVTARTFAGMTRPQMEQLAHELDKALRDIRGTQVPLDDLPAVQKKNRKIGRLNNALMILRTSQQGRRR
jgi:hypothetical protein